jgi:hypothetical protein
LEIIKSDMAPSSALPKVADGRAKEGYNQDKTLYNGSIIVDWPCLERYFLQRKQTGASISLEGFLSQYKKTETNISSKHEQQAETDLEKSGQAEKPTTPAPGGVHSADFPDGGINAWLVVLGGWCGLFCSFGLINSIGTFQTYYQQHQLSKYDPSAISLITSMETFMMFIGGPIFGKCFDNYGPRWLLIGGTVAHVFGLMMTSLSSEYYQFFLTQGCVSAIGASAIFYTSMGAVGTWFFRRRAFAYGIMISGSSLGGVVLPIIVMKLISHIDFAWTMRVVAFILLGMLIIANPTVKTRLTPQPKPLILTEFITPFKEMPFMLTVAGSWMFMFATFLPFTYIILQAQQDSMSEDLSNYLLPILNTAR